MSFWLEMITTTLTLLWAPFAFGEAYFHKNEGKETLSILHNNLNTTNDNTGIN
jgi:hypothetical protein